MAVRVRPGEEGRSARIETLLRELGIYTDARAAVVLALTDEQTPNEFTLLRNAGLPFAAAARTSHLFDYVAERLGLSRRLDREQRDYVMVQLREVGIIDICWVLSAAESRKRGGQLIAYGVHDAKSPNNAYVVTNEAAQLLLKTTDEDWPQALAEFVTSDEQRRLRIARRKATETVAAAGGSAARHGALIRACSEALLASRAAGYELVFIDEEDGERINPRWQRRLDQLGLAPDLDSLWPDAILVHEATREIWFIDAVKTDGEITDLRAEALKNWAQARGYLVGGMTTAYETWKNAARRQGPHQNIAPGTSIWIVEDGGKLFLAESLA